MTPIDLFERQLPDGLADLADARVPGYLDDILAESRRTRQRPRWTFLERWLPMALISARPATAPPLRQAWVLFLTGLVIAALVASLVIAGALIQRSDDPDGLNAAMLVPTLEVDQVWDATIIPGLSQPSGIDVGPDGNLYVVNAGADEILVLSPDGDLVRRWGQRGADSGQFYFQQDSQIPTTTIGGIGVSPDGAVYVADTVNDRVQRFDADGTFVASWGGFGADDGHFLNPFDVAVGVDGSVLVADFVRDDIQRFDADGRHLQTIGAHGTADGQLGDTGGVAVDAKGVIYNADFGNDRLQAFHGDGTFGWSVGRVPGDPVTLTSPGDVAVDGEGFIYVTEKDRLTVLTPDREVASTWQLPANAVDEEWLPIAVADDGTVYLSAEYSGLIYKLRNMRREVDVAAVGSRAAEAPVPSLSAGTPAVTAAPASVEGTFTVGPPFPAPFTAFRPAEWVPGSTTTGSTSMDLMRPGSSTYIQAAVRAFVPTNAYEDPCLSMEPMSPPVGPTVDDLTAALTNLPGILVTEPVADITIDGFSGKTFDLESTLIAGDCPAGAQWAPMWTYDENGRETFAGPGDNFHQRIAILDVDGTRVLVEIWTFDDTAPAVVADAIRIF